MSITLVSGNEEITGTLDGTIFTTNTGDSFTVTKNGDIYNANGKDWTVKQGEGLEGGRKRRSSKKYKKGGNKHTIGGRKSKKCKKGGKKSKKTRRH